MTFLIEQILQKKLYQINRPQTHQRDGLQDIDMTLGMYS
jgi:hypothetical protein